MRRRIERERFAHGRVRVRYEALQTDVDVYDGHGFVHVASWFFPEDAELAMERIRRAIEDAVICDRELSAKEETMLGVAREKVRKSKRQNVKNGKETTKAPRRQGRI